jgi:hypothetical protein
MDSLSQIALGAAGDRRHGPPRYPGVEAALMGNGWHDT